MAGLPKLRHRFSILHKSQCERCKEMDRTDRVFRVFLRLANATATAGGPDVRELLELCTILKQYQHQEVVRLVEHQNCLILTHDVPQAFRFVLPCGECGGESEPVLLCLDPGLHLRPIRKAYMQSAMRRPMYFQTQSVEDIRIWGKCLSCGKELSSLVCIAPKQDQVMAC